MFIFKNWQKKTKYNLVFAFVIFKKQVTLNLVKLMSIIEDKLILNSEHHLNIIFQFHFSRKINDIL